MHLNSITPKTPSQRAKKLGLSSSRFLGSSMSANSREAIEFIKKKDRSDNKVKISLQSWMNGHKENYTVRMPLNNCSIHLRIS